MKRCATWLWAAAFEYNGKTYPNMITAGIDGDWAEIGNKAARFGAIDPENRELHSVLSTGLTQTRFLDSRAIKRELAGPAFDFTRNEATANNRLADFARAPSCYTCKMAAPCLSLR